MSESKQSQYSAFPEFEDSVSSDGFDDERTAQKLESYFSRKRRGQGLGKNADDQLTQLLLGLAEPVDHAKLASMDLRKRAEIIKRIQSHFHRALPSIGEQEPELDDETLEEMGEHPGTSLADAGSLGMVLKPREFQRMSLCSMGHKGLADELDERGVCFQPHGGPGKELFPFDRPMDEGGLLNKLGPMIEDRSGLYPPLKRRSIRITVVMTPKPGMGGPTPDHPCMDQLSDGYAGYRRRLLRVLPLLVQLLFRDHPSMIEPICGSHMADQAVKPLADQRTGMLQSLFGMFPSMYFNRVHLPEPVSEALDRRPNTAGLEREKLQAD